MENSKAVGMMKSVRTVREEVLVNLLPNENSLVWPVETVVPVAYPEDSPVNTLSSAAAASGNLIKVAETALRDQLLVATEEEYDRY